MKKKNPKDLTTEEIQEMLREGLEEAQKQFDEQFEEDKMVRVQVANFALLDFLELFKKERPYKDVFLSKQDGGFLVSWSK